MKKMITKTALLLLFSVFFVTGMKAQHVSGVALSNDTITLGVDSTAILTATISPSNAENTAMVWSTTDAAVADTVSVTGNTCTIKGISVGEAKIIVTTDEGYFRDTCVVRVVIPVDSVTLEHDSLTMILSSDTTLIAKIYPPDPTNGEMLWTSSEPSVVDIVSVTDDSICSISALRLGIATIFVESVDGAKRDSCVITVNADPVDSLVLSTDSIKGLPLGSDTTLTARVEPFGRTNDSVVWKSGDITVVEIISSGYDTVCTIKAISSGNTYIHAYSVVDGDKKDSCYVSVAIIPATGISLNTDSIDLRVHTDTVLIAGITPPDATNDSIRWTSSDSTTIDIISDPSLQYDVTCAITASKSGSAYIYAQTVDGGYKDSCFVSVIVPVDSIVLDSLTIRMDLKADTTALLKARIFPDSATFIPLEWRQVNAAGNVVRIDSIRQDTLCYIKALASGVDSLYVVAADGLESTFRCYVTVAPRLADSVRISTTGAVVNDTLNLNVGDSSRLTVSVYPANVTNDTVTLTSSASQILRIDSLPGGVFVKALSDGVATVSAVSADGSGQKDSCVVKVRSVPATGIRLNKDDTLYVNKGSVDSLVATILPSNATDKTVIWRSDDVAGDVLDIDSYVDSIYKFTALKVDTVLVYAYAGLPANGIKDSCFVIVRESTGNEPLEKARVFAYTKDRRLYVNTAKAETVYVYSSNGSLLFVKNKAEGVIVIELNVEDKILFIKGSSGWAQKVVNL
jgi:uncharacterized protein YjdB